MNELNSDFVLWISIGALVLSIVALIGFGWKATRGMEGLETDEFSDDKKQLYTLNKNRPVRYRPIFVYKV